MRPQQIHSQKKQLTQLYIFILASLELSLYSWIACLDDDIQLSELFLLRVYPDMLKKILLHGKPVDLLRYFGRIAKRILKIVRNIGPSLTPLGSRP